MPQHLGDVDKNVEEVEEGQRAFPHLPSAVSLVTQSSGADSPNLKREGSDPSLEKVSLSLGDNNSFISLILMCTYMHNNQQNIY